MWSWIVRSTELPDETLDEWLDERQW